MVRERPINPDVAELEAYNAEPRAWIRADHRPLPPADRDWLLKLHEETWQHHPGNGTMPGHSAFKRKLTAEEWTRVLAIAEAFALPLSMVNVHFGFSVGVEIWDTDPLEPLIVIGARQLPGFVEPNPSFEYGWEQFNPLTHSERNRKRLLALGMPAPRDKGFYDY